MFQQKCGPRFSAPSNGKTQTTQTIVISSVPVETPSEPIKPKSPEGPHLRIESTHNTESKRGSYVGSGGNYERRRYGRYFSRFSQKSPPMTFAHVSSSGASSPSIPSEVVTESELRKCLQEALEEWRVMIPEFAEEIAKHIKFEPSSSEVLPPTSGEFIPFFNDSENKTIGSKTTLDENGYIHLRVGLAGCLFSDDILIYPFGSEKVSLEVGENQLKMKFESTEGKKGRLLGTLIKNEENIHVIRIESCLIDHVENPKSCEIVDFSMIDLPLLTTFEGGLI